MFTVQKLSGRHVVGVIVDRCAYYDGGVYANHIQKQREAEPFLFILADTCNGIIGMQIPIQLCLVFYESVRAWVTM